MIFPHCWEIAMGLLDALAGPLLGSLSGVTDEGHQDLVEELGSLIERVGGLEGIVGRMERHGLGAVAASWIGNGPNLPISPQQIEAIFGAAEVDAVAQKVRMPATEVASHLSVLLPQVVDHLTPDGSLPEWGAIGGLLGTLE
jgi:uncharacterized protein YidB (DUF937 family)